jgi:hypothetical protein
VALEDEIDDILRELLRERGALAAHVVHTGEAAPIEAEGPQLRAPLGGATELVLTHNGEPPAELPAALERCARELRAALRRWGAEPHTTEWPTLASRRPRHRRELMGRITTFLEALAATHHVSAISVLRGKDVVVEVGHMDEMRSARLAFIRKRLDAEAARTRGKSSHAEIHDEEVYARSFWFDAYLILFFDAPYPLDFVRHRARAVTQELGRLIPHLDDDPTTPASTKPVP